MGKLDEAVLYICGVLADRVIKSKSAGIAASCSQTMFVSVFRRGGLLDTDDFAPVSAVFAAACFGLMIAFFVCRWLRQSPVQFSPPMQKSQKSMCKPYCICRAIVKV